MSRPVWAMASGALFGAGLVVSGLSNPAKVQNFLDLTGSWDPSLMVVMAVALAVTGVGYRWIWRRQRPACDTCFHVPERTDVDWPLVAGAALFGLGWGLVGYCPGPAITALVIAPAEGVLFVALMVAGLLLQRKLVKR